REQRTKPLIVFGASENFAEGARLTVLAGRFLNGPEVQYRRNVVVLGYTPYALLFEQSGIDPLGKTVRVGSERFTIVGVLAKRPGVGSFTLGQDDFVVIPYTVYQRVYGIKAARVFRNLSFVPIQISLVPREGVTRDAAVADVERVLRTRHG